MANEKRLIDANALMDDVEMDGALYACLGAVDDVRFIVDSQPTVDAVEVVRCRDCKHRVYVDMGDEIGEIGGCKLFKMAMPYDNFCSYGERINGDG